MNICLVCIFPTLLSAIDFIFSGLGFSVSSLWIDGSISAVATMTPASGVIVKSVVIGIVWLIVSVTGGTVLFRRKDIK